nr:fatty acid hydroxylase family protein [Burkholderiaceae bacterium]
MMSERQRKFREQYRSNISPLYNGLVHIGVIYAIGLSAIWFCVQRLENVGWEWLVILPV